MYLIISTLLLFSLTLPAFPSHTLFFVTFWIQLVLLVYMWVWGLSTLECGQPHARGHSTWENWLTLPSSHEMAIFPQLQMRPLEPLTLATLEYWPVYSCTCLVHTATASMNSSCLVTSRRHCFTAQQCSWHSDSYSLPIFPPTMSSEPLDGEGMIQMFPRGLGTPRSLKDPPRNIFVLEHAGSICDHENMHRHVDVNLFVIENQNLIEETSPSDDDIKCCEAVEQWELLSILVRRQTEQACRRIG